MAWLKPPPDLRVPRLARVSDVAPGGQQAWPARPGRARSPAKARHDPENRNWWLRQLPGGRTRRAEVRGCRPPGLPTVVSQATDPAARPALARAALPVASRCHPALAGTTAARHRRPAPQRQPQLPPAPASCRNHPRPGLPGGPPPARGTAPAQGAPATPAALQVRSPLARYRHQNPHATPLPPAAPAAPARSQGAAGVPVRLRPICRIYSRCCRRAEHDHEAFFV